MAAKRTAPHKEKPVAVRVVKSQKRPVQPAKHLTPAPADPHRERLLWRSVAAGSVVILLIAILTVSNNLSKPHTTDSFWSNLTNRVAQVGNEFSDFWKELVGSKTQRPEDKYKELEDRVFPPLPASAQQE